MTGIVYYAGRAAKGYTIPYHLISFWGLVYSKCVMKQTKQSSINHNQGVFMSQFFLKIAVCVAGISASSLFADVDAAQLGRDMASDTMCGLQAVIQKDWVRALQVQSVIDQAVKSVKAIRSVNQIDLFLESGIDALHTISFRQAAGFNQYQVLQTTFTKFVGIEILQKTLSSLFIKKSLISGSQQELFSRLPFNSREERNRALARAAIKACQEVGEPCDVSEDQIVNKLWVYRQFPEERFLMRNSVAAELVIALVYGDLGDNVAGFLIRAHMFDLA